MNSLAEQIRQGRLNQPKVTLAEARAQIARHQAVKAGIANAKGNSSALPIGLSNKVS